MTDHRGPAGAFPWEQAHAAPGDRALGLELELIELVRRQDDIFDKTDPEAIELGRQIGRVQDELLTLVDEMPLTV